MAATLADAWRYPDKWGGKKGKRSQKGRNQSGEQTQIKGKCERQFTQSQLHISQQMSKWITEEWLRLNSLGQQTNTEEREASETHRVPWLCCPPDTSRGWENALIISIYSIYIISICIKFKSGWQLGWQEKVYESIAMWVYCPRLINCACRLLQMFKFIIFMLYSDSNVKKTQKTNLNCFI